MAATKSQLLSEKSNPGPGLISVQLHYAKTAILFSSIHVLVFVYMCFKILAPFKDLPIAILFTNVSNYTFTTFSIRK